MKNDHVRPTSVVHGLLGDETLLAWAGPGSDETETSMKGRDWQPYIRVMPHSEHPSGSSCICSVIFDVARLVAGTDEYVTVVDFKRGSSTAEPGKTPREDVRWTANTIRCVLFFTHPSVSTLYRVPFQLTDELTYCVFVWNRPQRDVRRVRGVASVGRDALPRRGPRGEGDLFGDRREGVPTRRVSFLRRGRAVLRRRRLRGRATGVSQPAPTGRRRPGEYAEDGKLEDYGTARQSAE